MFLFGDPVIIINFILCILISTLAFILYQNNKKKLLLQISYSFGLFTLTHLYFILKLEIIFKLPLIITLIAAYSILIAAILYEFKEKIKTQISNPISKMKRFLSFLIIFTTLVSFYLLSEIFISNPSIYSKLYFYNGLILSLITASLSFIGKIKKIKILYFFSIAFSMFALSHLANILDLQNTIGTELAILRIGAYFIVLFGIYKFLEKELLQKVLFYTANIKIQISMLAIMIIIIISLFYVQNKSFSSMDTTEPILRVEQNQKLFKIKEIQTGLFIKNFSVFDSEENNFTFNGTVWFEFDPYLVSINDIESFSFDKGTILKKGKVKTKIIDEKIWAYYKLKVNFKSNLNYQLFPLDDHKIYITLINTNLNPDSEMFISYNTNFVMNKNVLTGDWKMSDHEVEYGYREHNFEISETNKSTKYPVVSFELSFQKSGIRKALVIFLPLYLIFFLSLFSLLVDLKSRGVLSLSVGSTSALIFDLIAIEDMSPDVRYFTIANKIYILLLISAFVILLFNIYVIKESKNDTPENLEHLKLLRSYIFLFFIFTTLISTYSLIS